MGGQRGRLDPRVGFTSSGRRAELTLSATSRVGSPMTSTAGTDGVVTP
jgi:hypothetical protein